MVKRICLAILFSLAALAGCRKSSGDDGPVGLYDHLVYYVRLGNLAEALVYNGNWNYGEFKDSGLQDWDWIPAKDVSGTTVSHPYGVRFIVYLKGFVLYVFDVSTRTSRRITTEANAADIVALVDTSPTLTDPATTYVFYTTNTDGFGNENLKVARLSALGTDAPATLEASVPAATTYTVRAAPGAADMAYYAVQGATWTVKRANLTAWPALTIDVMTGADNVTDWIARNGTKLVYRRSTGEILKSVLAPPAATTVLVTPAGGETLALEGRVESGLDSEIYYTKTTSVPDVHLHRVMFETGADTMFDSVAYTTITRNDVLFTGTRVLWALITDASAFLRSYSRATPAGGTDLVTVGRALATGPVYVSYGTAQYNVLFRETLGGTSYWTASSDTGTLAGSYTFAGTPGPTHALSHRGQEYLDPALDLVVADGLSARICFVEGTTLYTLAMDLAPGSLVNLGALPADITELTLPTSFRSGVCLEGLSTPPVQRDVFFFHSAGGAPLLRQTASSNDEFAIAAH
jgi:hypothetical protein